MPTGRSVNRLKYTLAVNHFHSTWVSDTASSREELPAFIRVHVNFSALSKNLFPLRLIIFNRFG